MQIFKVRQDGFKEVKKLMLVKTIPIFVVTMSVGLFVFSKSLNYTDILPYYIPFIVVLISFGAYQGVKRQKALFESYTLTITNNLITREQLNTPTIAIYFNDIQEVAKNKNGSFTVKGKDAVDLIGIPAQMDDYFQLETALQQIRPIVVIDKISFLQKYQSLTSFLTVGLMFCVYTVNNKIVVGLAGSTLVALLFWSFIKIQNSKNVDIKTKRSMWWIIVVLASVIAVMIF